MPLGTGVSLGPGHIVLDGDPPIPKGHGHTPEFSVCYGQTVGWPNGFMGQDATWYGGRPRPHCVRWGSASPNVCRSHRDNGQTMTTMHLPITFISVIMVALWIGQTIIFLPCGFFFFLSFFFSSPNLSRRRLDVCHTSTLWCGLSANLRRRSETCCTRLAEIQDAKNRQKFTISAPSHNFVGLYLCNSAVELSAA